MRQRLLEGIVTIPTVVFGFIVATLFGASFHLVLGGDVRHLALLLLAGWLGYLLGHLAGVALEINIMNVGALRMLTASLGALIALVFTHALASSNSDRQSSR